MICVAAMLPLYSRIGMSPRIMAGLIILAGGVMNMTPGVARPPVPPVRCMSIRRTSSCR